MKLGHHDVDDVLTTTVDVLIDIMQDEQSGIRQRLDACWTVAQLVAPRLQKRPTPTDFQSDLVRTPDLMTG